MPNGTTGGIRTRLCQFFIISIDIPSVFYLLIIRSVQPFSSIGCMSNLRRNRWLCPRLPSKGFVSALHQEPSGPWTPVSPSVYVTKAMVTYTEGAWEGPRQHYAQHNAIGQSPETESLVEARGLNSRTFRKYDTHPFD